MLLTLNELQEENDGLSEANILNNRLDTGELSVLTFLGAVKHRAAVGVSVKDNKADDVVTVEVHGTECRKKRSHQGTQTNPFFRPIADIGVCEPIEETRVNSCKYNAWTS